MSTEQIPADCFLDRAISALESTDASELSRLVHCASSVATPVSQSRYWQNYDIFAALLEATGRNLRLVCRATERKSSDHLYLPAFH